MWPLALVAGLGTGTDAATWWFRSVAIGCVLAVGAALAWRTSEGYGERGMRRVPRRLPSFDTTSRTDTRPLHRTVTR